MHTFCTFANRNDLLLPWYFWYNSCKAAIMRLFEKLRFSNSLSIETTLSIEYSAVCARLTGTLANGLYKNPRACRGFL